MQATSLFVAGGKEATDDTDLPSTMVTPHEPGGGGEPNPRWGLRAGAALLVALGLITLTPDVQDVAADYALTVVTSLIAAGEAIKGLIGIFTQEQKSDETAAK